MHWNQLLNSLLKRSTAAKTDPNPVGIAKKKLIFNFFVLFVVFFRPAENNFYNFEHYLLIMQIQRNLLWLAPTIIYISPFFFFFFTENLSILFNSNINFFHVLRSIQEVTHLVQSNFYLQVDKGSERTLFLVWITDAAAGPYYNHPSGLRAKMSLNHLPDHILEALSLSQKLNPANLLCSV